MECIVCDFREDLVGQPVKPHQYIKYAAKYIPDHLNYYYKNGKCLVKLAQILRGRKIDIVHSNNTVVSVGYDIAKRLNSKFVWHLRGFMNLDFGCMPLRGWHKYSKTLREADAVIGITKSVLEHYIPLESKNTYVISDAVRSKDDTCLVMPKKKYFLFVAGFLTEQKGCGFAIAAFARSGLALNGYKLIIIGEAHPKYMLRLNRFMIGAGISDAVEFLGRSDQVKEYMSRATAFMMCSDNEGLGRVSIEAMFYGCLVIGRNSGGTKDFISDGETGLLFSDMDGCIVAMQNATRNDHQDIIKRAQQFAQENFSFEVYGDKILDVYSKVLSRVLMNN
ncbi:glycosyltransferase family 4 protein [Vulcanococcus limneticus Candia 3F8]|uniref:glycosyltransferase family 4 protein n=1 Tax=Vulcanococcus limneticus TaxID=2170428 RepID=UPI0012FF8D31|nr:glycosyltransferase family 4 protein [Vulcanococcus limneticus]MCP9791132.1 glycosyltransferase family 4 protein [Vulcanococcus limneticus MW73D5]MCP9893718.1 glycosyltransferase family 4 protein [Vulcanococcus limneticus Candia 3F8]MCP9896530.1 glycosyltransferase family 4 protein [Vulcanococcus limneticus Candia 3B3]